MNFALGTLVAGLVLVVALMAKLAVAGGRGSLVSRRLKDPGSTQGRGASLLAALPEPPTRLARGLASAGLGIDARRIWALWSATVTLVIGTALLAGGPGLALVAALTTVVAPAIALRAASGRGDRLLEDSLPDALEAMARSLRSGASLHQAVGEAAAATQGTLGADLGSVAHEASHGRALTAALDQWAVHRPLPGVRLATSALGLGAETGGAQARALDGVAATLRSRRAVGREVRALSSQARMSGVVITLAPLGFSALAAATDERTASFLLATPLGLFCLASGLALDGAAALWMQRLSRIEV